MLAVRLWHRDTIREHCGVFFNQMKQANEARLAERFGSSIARLPNVRTGQAGFPARQVPAMGPVPGLAVLKILFPQRSLLLRGVRLICQVDVAGLFELGHVGEDHAVALL